ncbi:olfactory receptor-like protein OLF3 [Alligator mississippiensis]|uniref:Olfactory receptor n=1 Tax=Alligator mississippiensis TaxID=8496 RepID=A0A151MUA8_ALLMI|nr:olfactory receptor-like protein OLF3 [Alligator mississippiensis]KYO28113.1 olfactory receptor 2F1 [Alligator mississippiensis]
MEQGNKTWESEFILLGLSNQRGIQEDMFVLFLTMYLVTLAGNLAIVTVIIIDSHLHTPMYYFLSHLAFLDICYTTTIIPQMLASFLVEHKTISFAGCVLQMFISLFLGGVEFILLAVMAYDRYVAICHPLRYANIMSNHLCAWMAAGSWLSGSLNAVVQTAFTLQLPFCGINAINHFGCEILTVQQLTCPNSSVNDVTMLVAGVLILLIPFFLVMVSYIHILSAILQIRTAEGRRKAFSTCTAHLTVVTLCYGTAIFAYLRPRSYYSPQQGKMISLFYCVVTPMLNPLIYSLRNQEVKGALIKAMGRKSLLNKHTSHH